MAKPKLVVTTPVGVFSRSTDRTYSHIVVARGGKPSWIRARLARELAYYLEQERDYAAVVAGGPLRAIYEEQRSLYPEYLARVRQEIACHEERLAATLAASAASVHGCHGWCGRLDLARKLASKTAETQLDVRVYTLDGQEVK
jgi:hypothetical protein